MPGPRPGEGPSVLWVGIGALVLLAGVVVLAWALGVQRLPGNGTAGESPAESLSRLAGGAADDDTARVARLGQLDVALDESSGVAVSRRHADLLWTHNDGTDNRLFAVRRDGSLVVTVEVAAPGLTDWEDIALAPCPEATPEDGDCLYLADTGDNQAARSDYAVYVVAEPEPEADRVGLLREIRFRYPEGPVDTEGLAVTPRGDLLLVTKGAGIDDSARLYRLRMDGAVASAESIRVAELVGTLQIDLVTPSDRITAAAVSPEGRHLAVRNHHAVYLVPLDEPLGAPVLCEIGIRQPQGEAMDFLTANQLILTSERAAGRAPMVRLRCP